MRRKDCYQNKIFVTTKFINFLFISTAIDIIININQRRTSTQYLKIYITTKYLFINLRISHNF
jgi:hypothetical protein